MPANQAKVTASIGTEHYRMEIATETNTLISDEPAELGGKDLGFAPDELLASALSACTSATVRMYADRKGWPLTGMQVVTTFQRDKEAGTSTFAREITFEGALDEEQRARLLDIANKCPVHWSLTHPISISTTVV